MSACCKVILFVIISSFRLLQRRWIMGCLLCVESVTKCRHT